jgi:hypothetical protein
VAPLWIRYGSVMDPLWIRYGFYGPLWSRYGPLWVAMVAVAVCVAIIYTIIYNNGANFANI